MINSLGVYHDPHAARNLASYPVPRRALFLDRDGVINRDSGYVHSEGDTVFLPGIFELCGAAHEAGFLPIVITNQAGIARGLYSEATFLKYTAWMHGEFTKRSVPLFATYYCPHHPENGFAPYLGDCICRKPKPGLLVQALQDYAIDPVRSLLIGDKTGDIEAGIAADVGTSLLLGEAALPRAGHDGVARIASLAAASGFFRPSAVA